MEFALADLGSYPKYYRYMADINRRGPDVLGSVPRLASLTALSAHHQIEEGAVLLDTRPQREFNQGHIPGAFAIPFGDNLATWVGWAGTRKDRVRHPASRQSGNSGADPTLAGASYRMAVPGAYRLLP